MSSGTRHKVSYDEYKEAEANATPKHFGHVPGATGRPAELVPNAAAGR